MGPIVAGLLTNLSLRADFFFNGMLFFALLLLAWRFVQPPKSPGGRVLGTGGRGIVDAAWGMGGREENYTPNPDTPE